MSSNQTIEITSRTYICEFEGCEKIFKEKGNLKTHFRTHVIKLCYFLDW